MELGFSKIKFSDWLGLSPSTWGKIENGEIQFSINTLYRFKERSGFNTWCIIAVGDYYESILKENQWEIVNQLEGDDLLLIKAKEYYKEFDVYGNKLNSLSAENSSEYIPILFTGMMNKKVAPIFQKICE
ncbi:helix-turn-helix transcriptional regulator [Endozoicomonas gorgoniicola]|uniref:Helix-turn-helix transcriptional regulator n=1 Tax=Endozoicomonas gorgoniicola TaxID=1234144 RepID=A0ABT3MYZ7_9GAMM|nr:helix-turn-helix transcriptional regulator [Endozoicomonas gorgoniicola]MCW7554596.1 helix-turn-helix transcriptional regulator [Endozoicomonas gorgoniicola]